MPNPTHNVTGTERTLSVVGGFALIGCGLRHRGLGGLLQIAIGSMALFRGATGHCELKAKLCPHHQTSNIARYSHMPLDSEVRTPDFRDPETRMPDSTHMGHERDPDTP